MSKVISTKHGNITLSDKELYFLSLYKLGGDAKCPDPSLNKYSDVRDYTMNEFFRFLNNPSIEYSHFNDFYKCPKYIEMMLSIIDVSCRYGLENGQLQFDIYRYENINNLGEYKDDNRLMCAKSTSWRIPEEFRDTKSKLLNFNFKTGFYPYINIEAAVGANAMYDEHEITLPPYLKCNINSDTVVKGFPTTNITLDNSYEESEQVSVEDIMSLATMLGKLLEGAWYNPTYFNEHIDSIKESTSKLKSMLINYANSKYREYSELFNKKYNIGSDVKHSKGDGILDAINKYINNPNVSFSQSGDSHAYALEYLIDNNFIPQSVIYRVDLFGDIEELKKYLCEVDRPGFRKLSEEEFDEILNLFDRSYGIGSDIYSDKMKATNELCLIYENYQIGDTVRS